MLKIFSCNLWDTRNKFESEKFLSFKTLIFTFKEKLFFKLKNNISQKNYIQININ